MKEENNKFKLIVPLKQHSPLIHFQHDQPGATLRATELKPKLDKFLITKVFKDDFQEYKKFLVEYDKKKADETDLHKALDYKIKIISPVVQGKEFKHSLFFGNIGKQENKIQSVSVPENEEIKLEIVCLREGLIDKIKSCLPEFFAVTNFGTRQDKGFGSFYSSEKDSSLYKDIMTVLPGGTPFIEIKSIDDIMVFSTVAYYYKRLKSGINPSYNAQCKPGYQKAYLYKYLDAKHDYTWEKRWIKETFFGLVPDTRNKKFARALLGLPGSYSFLATDEPCNPDKQKIKLNHKAEIEVKNKEIARIPSPLTFKIIKDPRKRITRVFILLNTELIEKIDEKICKPSVTFGFSLKFPKTSGSIPVPNKMIDIKDLITSYHESELKHRIKAFFENKNIEAEIKTI